MVDSPLGPPAQSQIFLPTVLVSTQRKANVYSIFQEVVQQRGSWGAVRPEAGHHHLQGDEGGPGSSRALGSTGTLSLPTQGPGRGWHSLGYPRPLPKSRLSPMETSGAGAGLGRRVFMWPS